MRPSTATLAVLLATALACGGTPSEAPEPPPEPSEEPQPQPQPEPEEPEAPDAWIDDAIADAVELETMPGTSGDPGEEHLEELRAFFVAHPEYEDPDERRKLADLACAFGFIDAHERFHDPKARSPYEVTVDGPGWKLMVAHASDHCTSDDWSWFTNEVQTAMTPLGVQWAYAGANHDVLVVKRGEDDVKRIPLENQGYLMLKDGGEPEDLGHDMPEGIIERAKEYFGG